MKLYFRECRRIATSLIYALFIGMIFFSWFQNFRGITQSEINMAGGRNSENTQFERPLLKKPEKNDTYFGSKTSEDHPEMIMAGVARVLLMEYRNNSYQTYPLGYYKAVILNEIDQKRVLEILCEITGLTEKQLKNLPKGYFPNVMGTVFSTEDGSLDENEDAIFQTGSGKENDGIENRVADKTKQFVPQVDYKQFKKLMREMETIIGEKGSRYSEEMMITYFGISEMTYEEACAEYEQTIQNDKVTGGFARLFCDYMGLALGLYPIFIAVMMWMKDRVSNAAELVYSRAVSSGKLVVSRYMASITMVLLPVLLLSFESLIPLLSFGAKHRISVDCFAYVKYILWWLLPTVMIVSAAGMLFTLLTDSPFAIVLQFLWWFIETGVTGLSGDTKITTLMIRHNTLRGCEMIEEGIKTICLNRLLTVGMSILFVALSVWILQQKRKGKINAADIYRKCMEYFQS